MTDAQRKVREVFAGTWLSYAGYYLCRKNFSVLMPLLVRDLHFSKDDLAQVIFFFSLAYAAGQFLTGTLADRLGAKTVVAVGMVLSAGCTLAMTWGSTLWFFAAMQLINGLAQSAGWPGLLKITGAWFDPSRRGVLMAWWSTNYVVGGFLATIAATWFATGPLAPEWGWKRGAAGPAFLLGLITLVFLVLVKERPSEADPRISAGRAWRQVLSSPQIHCIAASYFCLKLTRYSFLYWLPLYMAERLRYRAADAGYSSSVYELAGFLGAPLAGYISDKWMGGRRFPVGAAMLFGLAMGCLVYSQISLLGVAANLAAISTIGILTYGPDTLLSGAATQDAANPEAMATASGYINGIGSAGQVVSPFVVAAAVRQVGWDGLFVIFAGAALLGAVILAARWKMGGEEPQARLANA